jgi:hypothetical protein
VVDRGGLENRCGFAPTVGSNPTLSAITSIKSMGYRAKADPLHVILHVGEAADFAGKPTRSAEISHAFVKRSFSGQAGCAA